MGRISLQNNKNRYIADEEIRNLYEGAACVVYPYYSATQSGVLSLAFYFETPVICSDIPFFKAIIEKSQSGILFDNGNVEDLKDKRSMDRRNCILRKKYT